MSLAAIVYPSPTPEGMTEWSIANFQHHNGIEIAMRQTLGVDPPIFRLWPILPEDFQSWLEQHQQAHNFFNQTLGLSGQDLTGLDLKDKSLADDWFFVHELEHQAAARVLKLSIL